MSTTQLKLYNGALGLCGETTLVDLNETRDARYALDEIWANGAILACLEAGQWNFAIRTSQLEFSPTFSPAFATGGYQYAFEIPEDWVRWTNICFDPYLQCSLEQYQTDNGFIFCDLDTIYVRYVSNDNLYGMDFSMWPQSFCRYAEAYLAYYFSIQTNKPQGNVVNLEKWMKKKLDDAKAKDAQQEPERERPRGKWAQIRRRSTISGAR